VPVSVPIPVSRVRNPTRASMLVVPRPEDEPRWHSRCPRPAGAQQRIAPADGPESFTYVIAARL